MPRRPNGLPCAVTQGPEGPTSSPPPQGEARPAGIDAAVQSLIEYGFAGTRAHLSRASQLRLAVATLREVKSAAMSPFGAPGAALGRDPQLDVADVTSDDVRRAVALWRKRDALSPGTINVRLCVLSKLGVDCRGNWVRDKLPLKWWLRPDECERLIAWLRGPGSGAGRWPASPFLHAQLTADYVEFVANVGLRVEEALRLSWHDVRLDLRPAEGEGFINASEITAMGTKTSRAQAALAINLPAALLLQRRFAEATDKRGRVFPLTYYQLQVCWEHCRKFLGASDNPLATLKALRRTAARTLTTKGMPLDVVRQYLRHENIETTMGYLRLVGGYSTAEQRRWL